MPDVGRKAPNKNHTQSVVFEKEAGWTKESSRKWCKDHEYYTDGLDVTETQFRFRQYDPDDSKFNYRTLVIKEKSIYLIRGILKARLEVQEMAAIKSHNTAVEESTWDGPAAVASMPKDEATLRYCHAWVDPDGDPDAKQSYKFPHHKDKGGPAILPGVRNALARLPNAGIPEGDKAGVESHLKNHLEKEKNSDAINLGIERRYFAEEMRVEQDGSIEGYAAVFNQLSEDLGGFREKIRFGAFTKTLNEADIRALFNHDPNYVLGRNKARTLDLEEDSHGLQFRVKPPETQWAKDLQESVRRKDINQASFGFRTLKDSWDTGDRNNVRRELIEVQLYDVSVVTYPAYPQTIVSARSLAEMFLATIQNQSDPETIQYLREQIDQIEAAGEPGQELHSADEEQDKQVQARLALRKRRLEINQLQT